MITIIIISILLLIIFIGRHLGIELNTKTLIALPGIVLFIFLVIPYAWFPTSSYMPSPLISHFIIWSLFSLYSYFVLYKALDIARSLPSCIWFYLNLLILYTYLIAFYTLLYSLKEPIYLEDLSYFAQYRYFIFVIIGVVGIGIYLLYLLVPAVNDYVNPLLELISYPYLYQETTQILAAWENTFWGPLFNTVIRKSNNSKVYRYASFIIHVVFSFIIPLIASSLFLFLVFSNGDLRSMFYLIPFSFLTWLYRHLFYYFITFLTTNLHALRECLNIIIQGPNISKDARMLCYNSQDVGFTLSDKALKEFGPEYNHQALLQGFANDFVVLGKCNVHIEIYQKSIFYLPHILFGIRYLSWLKIFLFFFYLGDTIVATNIFFKFMPTLVLTRSYATKAYHVHASAHSVLEAATNGAYKAGHPVTTDTAEANAQGEVPFKHQPTLAQIRASY